MQPNRPQDFDFKKVPVPPPAQSPRPNTNPSSQNPEQHSQQSVQDIRPPVPRYAPSQPSQTPQPVFAPTSYSNEGTTLKPKKDVKNILFSISLFVLAPIFAIMMILYVFQSYVVDGSSMEPTLHNGNRVFILKLPKSIANLKGKEFVPSRNEVIVFKKPGDEGTQLIKRVIGLPGDRVVIENGKVTVFNVDHPEGFDPGENTDYGPTLDPTDTNGTTISTSVGQGEIFVLGDNRRPGGSLDSRSFGVVQVQNIIGRLWIRYFPISQFDTYATQLTFSLKNL